MLFSSVLVVNESSTIRTLAATGLLDRRAGAGGRSVRLRCASSISADRLNHQRHSSVVEQNAARQAGWFRANSSRFRIRASRSSSSASTETARNRDPDFRSTIGILLPLVVASRRFRLAEHVGESDEPNRAALVRHDGLAFHRFQFVLREFAAAVQCLRGNRDRLIAAGDQQHSMRGHKHRHRQAHADAAARVLVTRLTCPCRRATASWTMDSPMPRPASSVTESTVEKPGSKTSDSDLLGRLVGSGRFGQQSPPDCLLLNLLDVDAASVVFDDNVQPAAGDFQADRYLPALRLPLIAPLLRTARCRATRSCGARA